MSYLVDTCVLSETIRPQPNIHVLQWLADAEAKGLFISCLTLGELEKGLAKVTDTTRQQRLQNWLQSNVIPAFTGRTLDVSTRVAREWGRLLAEQERKGQPVPVIDAILAATAQVHGLTIATRNLRDFVRCGATVVDPWTHNTDLK